MCKPGYEDSYWCCAAEFGQHERDCPNFTGPVATTVEFELQVVKDGKVENITREFLVPATAHHVRDCEEPARTAVVRQFAEHISKFVLKGVCGVCSHQACISNRSLADTVKREAARFSAPQAEVPPTGDTEAERLRGALKSISSMLHGSWDNVCSAMTIADKALAGWSGVDIPPAAAGPNV
jgi:hypothetical protein